MFLYFYSVPLISNKCIYQILLHALLERPLIYICLKYKY